MCDALIILKQSLAGWLCIVQKSRGNREKEGTWTERERNGIGTAGYIRFVCSFVGGHASDGEGGRGGEEGRGSALLSRVYEIPVPGLDRLIDRVDCQRFHPERRSPRDARQKKPCRYALLRSDATRARVRFPPRYATHFSSPIPPSRRDELSHPEMRPTAVTGE